MVRSAARRDSESTATAPSARWRGRREERQSEVRAILMSFVVALFCTLFLLASNAQCEGDY